MKRKLLLTSAAVASVMAMAAAAAPASAATGAVSENWAGYEATSSSGAFSAASGSWVQPAAKCTAGSPTYSAFWVGLGGGSQSSSALEQIGTQSDCTSGGSTQYYAWYELVPKAPVKLAMTIKPGDRMYARVAVSGSTVTLTLDDQTSGAAVTKTLQMSSPDTSTAEWVAEAPSQCTSSLQDCTPLPLSDFGSVKFTNAYATSDGHTASIGGWNAQAISLAPSSSNEYVGYGYGGYAYDMPGGSSNSAGAQPSSLSTDGTSFTVSYEANPATATSTSYPGYGYGGGDGYGGSGYGYGGYGGGYGYGPGAGYGDYGGGYGYGGYAGY